MSDFHHFHTLSSFLPKQSLRQDLISALLLGGRYQAKHLKSNPVLGSIWGETQTKAACTIGKSCHRHAQEEAVGKKASLVCSLHLGVWVGYHDPPHFNLVPAPCCNHHSQSRTVSGRAPESNEALGAAQACLALSTNPEPRQQDGAPEKRELLANWCIQRGHQSFPHRNNFSNLLKESLILAVLDNGGSPIGLPTVVLFWFLFS